MSAFEQRNLIGIYPLPFLLRENIKSSWFRIHSLPQSKRYPENDTDWNILMARHREVSNTVLGNESLCNVFYAVFDTSDFPFDDSGLIWEPHSMIKVEEEYVVNIKVARILWDFDRYADWIRSRSVDELG